MVPFTGNGRPMWLPQPGVLLLHGSTVAPDSIPLRYAVADRSIWEIEAPVRQLAGLSPEEIARKGLTLLVPLYLAQYSRKLRSEPAPELAADIVRESAVLCDYLRTLHEQGTLDAPLYAALIGFCKAAIAHYAASAPKLKKDLEEIMGAMYIETRETKIIDESEARGRAEGLAEGRREERKKTLLGIVRHMAANGATVEEIAITIGIPEQEIAGLANT